MTDKPRILYVLNAMGGGASLGIYEFLRHTPNRQFAAYAVVPPGTDAQYRQIRPLFEDCLITPLHWWNIKTELDPLRRFARTLGQRRRGITLERNTADIVRYIQKWHIDLVHTGTALTLAGPFAAQQAGIPHIWHIKESIGSKNRVQFRLPDAELVAYMDGLSDRIIAMSDYIAGVFREHNSDVVTVIPDGVDLSRYYGSTSRTLREKLGLDENTVLVGMVAGLTSTWKRHDLFIRMAAELAPRLPQARFLLIGEKPNPKARWPHDYTLRYYELLTRLAQKLIDPERLIFLDHFPDSGRFDALAGHSRSYLRYRTLRSGRNRGYGSRNPGGGTADRRDF